MWKLLIWPIIIASIHFSYPQFVREHIDDPGATENLFGPAMAQVEDYLYLHIFVFYLLLASAYVIIQYLRNKPVTIQGVILLILASLLAPFITIVGIERGDIDPFEPFVKFLLPFWK